MLKKVDFENIVRDFLFAYEQLLLHGKMHQRVGTDIYQGTPITWNAVLKGLEAGVLLGLARLLERKNDLGRSFNYSNLDSIAKKIINLRHGYIAHADFSKMRDMEQFLKENELSGTDIILMFGALKSRLINYQKSLGCENDVNILFKLSTSQAMEDLDIWLKSFKTEM